MHTCGWSEILFSEYQRSPMFCSEGHIDIGSPQEEISVVPLSLPFVNMHYIILSVFFSSVTLWAVKVHDQFPHSHSL